MEQILNYIGGEFHPPKTSIDNYCPSTGQVYSRVPNSDAEDVSAAIAAAQKAFPIWSSYSPEQRATKMLQIADLIDKNREALARAESLDQGKPLWLSRNIEIPRASSNFRYFAHAIMHKGSEAYSDVPGSLQYVNRLPLGPCALISPWNLPLYLLTWKIAPCIAAGNTAVSKPSELTPMTAFLFSKILTEADIPPGTINIIHGEGRTTGDALIKHPDVPVISFTGGTATGAYLAKTVGPSFKKISLELGGKNPNLIFADADLEKALKVSLRASFQNQGEICLCGSRMLVQESIFEKFVEDFVKATDQLQVGDPLQEGNFMGALVSKPHLDKVKSYVELAKAEGGTVRTTQTVEGLSGDHKQGYFMRPTVITGLDHKCRTNQEEIFGPVITITPFRDEAHGVKLANDVSFGLAASLWTSDISRAHRMAKSIRAGNIWINDWMKRDLRAPFGGMKASGVGREGGNASLNFFTEAQSVSVTFD